jgi:hypothetical protein
MKTVIENLDSITGWTASAGCAIHGLNDHKEYIAGHNSKSLVLSFPVAGYCQKVLASPISLGDNDRITISVWSRKNRVLNHTTASEFVYKISFGTAKEYYLPVGGIMNDVTFDVSDLSSIEQIKITYSGDEADYLIISYCVMSRDEIPYDIFVGLKDAYDNEISQLFETRFLVGTIGPHYAGDSEIVFDDEPEYARRYSMIKITDGVNSEYHHIDRKSETEIGLSELFDGDTLVNSFTSGASVYLCIPFLFGRHEDDAVLPSICVWGLAPENEQIESDVQTGIHTWKASDGSAIEQRFGKWFTYDLLIACESINTESLAIASEMARMMISRKVFWVNGRKFDIDFSGTAVQVDAVEANEVDKIQYSCSVRFMENVFESTRLPATSILNITVEPGLNE